MAIKSAPHKTCSCGERPDCGPECTGLECLERPRFFCGQLLTEAELNSEQAYVLAKNRLHNLHLHGWGVVCGLEVTCHECPGWVTVHPGYAIDSCGNDVIVCRAHDVNVREEIRRCKEARRKLDDCRCPPRKECPEGRVEHWCLELSYLEKEARPTTALNQEPERCGCGCTCGGHGAGGCRCGGPVKAAHCDCHTTAKARRGAGKAPYACEPTRILESYRLELCEAPEDYCRCRPASGERRWLDKFRACLDLLKGSSTGSTAPLGEGLDQLYGLLSLDDAHLDLQTAFNSLRDLFRRLPGTLHCGEIERLPGTDIPASEERETLHSSRGEAPASELLRYLLLDCFAHAVLPSCAPCCPGEDPLILACMTIRDGKILEIRNYPCRRYAGFFPPSLCGFHLGPLLWQLTTANRPETSDEQLLVTSALTSFTAPPAVDYAEELAALRHEVEMLKAAQAQTQPQTQAEAPPPSRGKRH